jgi:hypothetical protein
MDSETHIRFNWLKHHLGAAVGFVLNSQSRNIEPVVFANELLHIGSNLLDIYTGTYSKENILVEVSEALSMQGLLKFSEYHEWLEKKAYRKIQLRDQSIWILRLGNNSNKFIHLHPARNSIHSFRTSGNAWKTALMLYFFEKKDLNGKDVNQIRKELLNLSPIKNISAFEKLNAAYDLLNTRAIQI